MSNQIPSQYILQYEDEMRLAYQFNGSKLEGLVRKGTNMGAGASPADYVGPMTANDNPSRLAPTPNNSAAVTRRWVYPQFFDVGTIIAKQDVSRTFNGGSLQTGYSQAQGKAMARKKDDIIMESLFITATTGQNAGSTTAFTAGNIIAHDYGASAATGCTISKLIEAKRILESGGVDLELETLNCLITSTDHAFLLKQIEIRSKDYNDKAQLVDGYLRNYLGINFIHIDFQNATYYPRAAAQMVNGSSERLVPLFAGSSVYLGEWQPIGLRSSEREDLSYAQQMYSWAECGATRLQEAGIVQIICA